MSLGQSPDIITLLARAPVWLPLPSLLLRLFPHYLPLNGTLTWQGVTSPSLLPPLLVPSLLGSREPVPGPLHLMLGPPGPHPPALCPCRVAGPSLWLEQVTIGCAVIRTSDPPCTLHVEVGGEKV